MKMKKYWVNVRETALQAQAKHEFTNLEVSTSFPQGLNTTPCEIL